MSAVYALYSDPAAAQKAVDGLRAAGVSDEEITVLLPEPLEHYEIGQRDHATVMRLVAVLGGLTGLAAGVALTSYTQLAWPLVTGGMPIVSIWPNMIPVFELTMLGAVLATVITFLITARLPGRMPELYDPAVSDGKILIGIADPQDVTTADLERTLQEGGEVKWLS